MFKLILQPHLNVCLPSREEVAKLSEKVLHAFVNTSVVYVPPGYDLFLFADGKVLHLNPTSQAE